MTVGDLIAHLSEMNPNALVQVNVNRAGEVFDIEQVDHFDADEKYGDPETVMIQVDVR